MNTPIHLDKINDPFMDLPDAAKPSSSPWDARLMFNTLAADFHRPFTQLMREISLYHMRSYNNPDAKTHDPHNTLYSMASAAGLDMIATEMARNWGVKDKDGHLRLPHCDSLRSWPDIESAAPHTVQIWLAHKKPTMMLWTFPLGGGDSVSVHKGLHTVFSEEGKVFKPGDWIGDLLVEYARYKIWRERYDEDSRAAPKPATTLKPSPIQIG